MRAQGLPSSRRRPGRRAVGAGLQLEVLEARALLSSAKPAFSARFASARDSNPAEIEASALRIRSAAAPAPQLSADEVQALLTRASAASSHHDAIIAVVDRGGRILGVRVENGVSPGIILNPASLTFAIDGAVSLARTAAFFANDQAPLTSRTIQDISQSTITQREVQSSPDVLDPNSSFRGPGFVSPIGLKGHFPPRVMFTPQVDLFQIEHTNRDSIISPGPDPHTRHRGRYHPAQPLHTPTPPSFRRAPSSARPSRTVSSPACSRPGSRGASVRCRAASRSSGSTRPRALDRRSSAALASSSRAPRGMPLRRTRSSTTPASSTPRNPIALRRRNSLPSPRSAAASKPECGLTCHWAACRRCRTSISRSGGLTSWAFRSTSSAATAPRGPPTCSSLPARCMWARPAAPTCP